jgi:hypothetical protein
MTRSIFLPDESETTVTVTLGNDTLDVDILELEDLVFKTIEEAKPQGVEWKTLFPSKFKKKYNKDISSTQAAFLFDAVSDMIAEIKKKLSQESAPSTE